jgi:hypothetical protein
MTQLSATAPTMPTVLTHVPPPVSKRALYQAAPAHAQVQKMLRLLCTLGLAAAVLAVPAQQAFKLNQTAAREAIARAHEILGVSSAGTPAYI